MAMFDVPHNTLVLYLNEKEDRVFSEEFIFYDYTTGKFGVRGKSFNRKNVPNVFAFDCADQGSVLTFLKEIHVDYKMLSVCLLNYENLPLKASDIMYEDLAHINCREMEIAGYDYARRAYSLNNLDKLLTMLRHMYTENK